MKRFSENIIDIHASCLRIHDLAKQNPLVAAIAAQGTEVVEMLLRKNLDYGSSVFSSPILSIDLTPEKALKVRMSDKIARMQSLDQSGKAHITSESYSDTVRDLAGYCILWLAVLASKKLGKTSVAGKASPPAGETGNAQPKRDPECHQDKQTKYKAGLTEAQKMALDPPTAEAETCPHQGCTIATRYLGDCGYCGRCVHASCSGYSRGDTLYCSSICYNRPREGKAIPPEGTVTAATPTEPVPLNPPTAEADPKAKGGRTYLGGWTRHLGEPAHSNDFIRNPGLIAAWIEAQQRNTLARSTASHAEGNDQTRLTSMAFAEGWDSAMEYLVSQLVSSPACDSLNALDPAAFKKS